MASSISHDRIAAAQEYLKWPLKSKENFLTCSVPIITYVVFNRFAEISAFYSLIAALGTAVCFQMYNDAQKIIRPQVVQTPIDPAIKKAAEDNDILMTTYLIMSLEALNKTLGNESERKNFLAVCEYFHLPEAAVRNLWVDHPSNSQANIDVRVSRINQIMPQDRKDLFVRLGLAQA